MRRGRPRSVVEPCRFCGRVFRRSEHLQRLAHGGVAAQALRAGEDDASSPPKSFAQSEADDGVDDEADDDEEDGQDIYSDGRDRIMDGWEAWRQGLGGEVIARAS